MKYGWYIHPTWWTCSAFIQISSWLAPWLKHLALHSIRLFHFRSTVKIRPFFPIFLLAESTAKAFCRLILFDFKKKSINHFLWHNFIQIPSWRAPWLKHLALHSIRLFHFHSTVKIWPFSPVFPLVESTAKAFCRLILLDFKQKAPTVFYDTTLYKYPPGGFHDWSTWLFIA